MKKSLVTIILCCMMTINLAACTGGNTVNSNTNAETSAPADAENTDNTVPQRLEPLDNEPKTIVVSILAANDFYKTAKEKYEKLHPNTTIQFKEFSGGSGGVMSESEVEKYIKQTTTEVLSGKGADLFAFTVVELPIDKYINKKAFVNLDEWMESDPAFDPSQYEMNILDGSRMNGGSYILPIEFYLEVLFGDAKTFNDAGIAIDDKNWSWSSFADIGKQLKAEKGSRVAMGNVAPETMLNNVVSDHYAQLVDGVSGKASFQTPMLVDLMQQVKSLYDDQILSEDHEDDNSFMYSIITSPSDYLVRLGLYFAGGGKAYQKPHSPDQKSGVSFQLSNQIAMNANSKVQRDAWEFMKFLLSEDMQANADRQGFAMNKAMNDQDFEELKSMERLQNTKGGNVKVKVEDLDSLRELLAAASIRSMGQESTIQKIITEESKAFFNGQKSTEAVAELIQNRVVTYLNE